MKTFLFSRYILFLTAFVVLGCKGPDFDLSCLGKKYTYEELKYFYQTGFSTKNRVYLVKWEEDLTVSFVKGATEDDYRKVDSIIADIRPLIAPLNIRRVADNGKIRITISNKYKGESSMRLGKTDKRLSHRFSGEYNIRGVNIWVASYTGGIGRKNIFRHELMHALGFSHVVDNKIHNTVMGRRRYASIEEFENRANLYDKYTDLDKAAIRMMYQECIPEGLRMADFKIKLKAYRKQDTTKIYLKPVEKYAM